MKHAIKLSLIPLILLAVAASNRWGTTLTWDDPNPPGMVSAYRVWREISPGSFTNIATVATNSWPISLPPGWNIVNVTAVSVEGLESEPSTNKRMAVVVGPGNLRIW